MSEWGDRIGHRMIELGLNQTEVAKACGIKPPSVNDWLSGKTKMIDGLNLVAAARVLQTSPEWIMHGKAAALSQSQSARLNADTIADAMGLLDELDSIAGKRISARPNPYRLAIACEVLAGGAVVDGTWPDGSP